MMKSSLMTEPSRLSNESPTLIVTTVNNQIPLPMLDHIDSNIDDILIDDNSKLN